MKRREAWDILSAVSPLLSLKGEMTSCCISPIHTHTRHGRAFVSTITFQSNVYHPRKISDNHLSSLDLTPGQTGSLCKDIDMMMAKSNIMLLFLFLLHCVQSWPTLWGYWARNILHNDRIVYNFLLVNNSMSVTSYKGSIKEIRDHSFWS